MSNQVLNVTGPAALAGIIDGLAGELVSRCSVSKDPAMVAFGKHVECFAGWMNVGVLIGGIGLVLCDAIENSRRRDEESGS
jgi:hypothetical protein